MGSISVRAIASEMGNMLAVRGAKDGDYWVSRGRLLSNLACRYPKVKMHDISKSINQGVTDGVFHMDTIHGPNFIKIAEYYPAGYYPKDEPKKWWEKENTPLARLMREKLNG